MSTAPVVQIAGTGAAAATWTTASFTPPANTRLVAYVSSYKATAGVALPTISDSLGTLTWTQLDDYVISTFANPDMRGTWFISSDVGGSPASMTVTVASTGANCMAVVVASVLTSEVSGSTVQVAHGEDLASGDPSLTFGSAPGATNITLVGASFLGANNATNPTGYTTIAQATQSTARRNAAVYDITSAGQTATWASNNTRSITLGIELAPAGNKTLAAGAGSYAITSTAASPLLKRVAVAGSTSYAITATAATLRRALPMVAGAASYAISATAATPKQARIVTAAAASYAITNTAAALKHAYVLAAGVSSYAITASAVTLTKTSLNAFSLAAGAFSYAITATAASVLQARKVVAGASSYAITSTPASVLQARKLVAAATSYAVTAQPATLKVARLLSAANTNYAITASPVTLTYSGGPAPGPADEAHGVGQMATMNRWMGR